VNSEELIPLALSAHRIPRRAALALCRVMGADAMLLASPNVGVRIGTCWLLPCADGAMVDIVGPTNDVRVIVDVWLVEAADPHMSDPPPCHDGSAPDIGSSDADRYCDRPVTIFRFHNRFHKRLNNRFHKRLNNRSHDERP
jgi:hypothetical protein